MNELITIHIFPNTSRSKSIPEIKLAKLIEYMTNIFLEKSYTKVLVQLDPDPFINNPN